MKIILIRHKNFFINFFFRSISFGAKEFRIKKVYKLGLSTGALAAITLAVSVFPRRHIPCVKSTPAPNPARCIAHWARFAGLALTIPPRWWEPLVLIEPAMLKGANKDCMEK